MKRTVISMLKDSSVKYEKIAYLHEKNENGWVKKTFAETDTESTYIASSLVSLGFKKDDKIAILSEGRNSWVIAEFGLLKAGCISVPLSIKLLPEEILFRLIHSESKAIFVSRNTIERISPIISKIELAGFKLFYFDKDDIYLTSIKEKFSIKEENIILYEKLIRDGKNFIDPVKSALENLNNQISEDDIVTICYTSGTTGNPKGIMLSHLNYWANSHDALKFFKLTEFFKSLLILPLDHAFAHTIINYISLIDGLGIYFVDSRGGSVNTLKNIPINLKEVSPDFLLTVPALTGNFMKKIVDAIDEKGGLIKKLFDAGLKAGIRINKNGFRKAGFFTQLANIVPYAIANFLIFRKVRKIFGDNLHFCVGGGALLDIKQQHFFYTLGVPIFQGYGLTEATPIISANCDHTHKLGTSGKILPGVECKIIKSDGTLAQTGEKGEIVIRGNNVMKGYYKNEKATNETIRDGWLYTGDMGYIDEDDFLVVVGREKALLISQDGEKYSPEEIEEAISVSAELVSQVMLYNDHSKFTTALITLDENRIHTYIKKLKIQSTEELYEAIKNSFFTFKNDPEYTGKFPDKWIPSVFRIVGEVFSEQNHMVNSTMKIVRFKIIEVHKALIEEMYQNDAKVVKNSNVEELRKFFK